ncbi:MAG TPA: 16S rRNA (cytosine(1402)-N(4))-methyltransferase [Porticoccaceae bacterium]|nr:16S rRNA (cytosine(1402)-N(4))-methyltransferase [Porticoccaceae bacterium]
MAMAYHKPALLQESVDGLSIAADGRYVDVTFGGGGHSKEILKRLSENGRLFAFDQDPDAEDNSIEDDRFSLIAQNFSFLKNFLRMYNAIPVDGVLADLGVSFHQFDVPKRGFSFRFEGPLDMRMDQSSGITAQEIIDSYSRGELIRIIRRYGEEKFAQRIVDNIIEARANNSIKSTSDLADLIKRSIPAPARRLGGNPAKRTFQALRIEVNQELAILERAIPACLERLSVGGRMVVMSFQSLEDKIVKNFFTQATESKTPLGLPVEIKALSAKFSLVFNGSQKASEDEILDNSRAKSVRLRAIERVAA